MEKFSDWGNFIVENVPILSYIERYENTLTERAPGEFIGGHSTHTSDGKRCLTINSDKGVFNCYSCKASGNVISYAMDKHGITDFREICQRIADEMNLTLPTGNWTPEQRSHYQLKCKQRTDTPFTFAISDRALSRSEHPRKPCLLPRSRIYT